MGIEKLNKYQRVYLTYKIFDYWGNGEIVYNNKQLLPKDFGIYSVENILKVYLACSKISNDDEVDKIFKYFKGLNIYAKLDFIIYLFDVVNDIDIIPNKIKDNLSLKDLSNKLLEYKLSL